MSRLATPPTFLALSRPPPIEVIAPRAVRLTVLGLIFLLIALALSFAMVMGWKTPDFPSVMAAFMSAVAGTILSYLGLYGLLVRPRTA